MHIWWRGVREGILFWNRRVSVGNSGDFKKLPKGEPRRKVVRHRKKRIKSVTLNTYRGLRAEL